MKKHLTYLTIFTLILHIGCTSQKKTKEIESYTYEEEKIEMSDEFKALVPDWVKEGETCYGLVVQLDSNNNPVKGKPVKAKIVQINAHSIKMKALESVSLKETVVCTKMGIAKGMTWDEVQGDFYLTKQDAINALIEQGIYKITDKVTID